MQIISSCILAAAALTLGLSSPSDPVQSDGFQSLLDGNTLANWHSVSLGTTQAKWVARDGVLTYESGDSWLASDKTYTDFVLRLEYRTGADTDSGIFLRSPDDGYPSFTGMELEIRDDAGAPASVRSTSALYGAVAPTKKTNKPAGEWNQVEVTVVGRHLAASWNGVQIHDVNLDDPAYAGAQRGPLSARARAGHIGFQAHLTGAPAEFRNIRIKNLE